MSPRRKFYTIFFGFWIAWLTCAYLAGARKVGAMVPVMLILMIAFGVWNAVFRCPRCGTPYLYFFVGPFVVPRWMPKACKKCSWPSDKCHDHLR